MITKEKAESQMAVHTHTHTLIINLIEKIRVVIVATLKMMRKILKLNSMKLGEIDFCLVEKVC